MDRRKGPHVHPFSKEELLSRRESVKQIGGWVIFAGALGATAALGAACGPEPAVDTSGAQNSPQGTTPTGTGTSTPTPTSTTSGTPNTSPTPTPSLDACGCNASPSGTNTSLKRTSIALNAVAYNSSAEVFICHDSGGFYCLDALCTHAGCDMGTLSGGYTKTNLGSGFYCSCHGSSFDANGKVTGGPAGSPLPHYQVAFDGSGNIWVDYNKKVGASCRCT